MCKKLYNKNVLYINKNERVIHIKKIRRQITLLGFSGIPNNKRKKTVEIDNLNCLTLPSNYIGFYINEVSGNSPSFFIINEENKITIKKAKQLKLFAQYYGRLLLFSDDTEIIFNSEGDFIVLEKNDKTFSSLKEAISNL